MFSIFKREPIRLWCVLLFAACFMVPTAAAADWYVSAERGKGKKATMEKPAKDLGNIISKLQPGDRVHIAQGVYQGRGKNGHYKIEIPISIIGGYNNDFTVRDPWGAHRTVFSGDNLSANFESGARILFELHMKYQQARSPGDEHNVLIDGVIVDNGLRNQYMTGRCLKIKRPATPAEGKGPTPGTPGIKITLGKYCCATVRNCVVMNCAVESSDGALSVSGGKCSKVTISNNLIINNTGNGIAPLSGWKPPTRTPDQNQIPNFVIENNTVLFCWKPGPIDEFAGSSLMTDDYTVVFARNNVFAFNDIFAVNNIRKATRLELIENLITANKKADYKDCNTEMLLDDIEDEAEYLGDETADNIGEPITVPMPAEWSRIYMGRKSFSRAQVTGSVKANNSAVNDLRSMLGLPLQAGPVEDLSEIWLHRVDVEGALAAGVASYQGRYGCRKPDFGTKTVTD